MQHSIFELGDVRLQSGETLRNARLAYATYGTLNSTGDNVVLLPTFYTGTHLRNEALFGAGRAIDPARHFIVTVNLFGNGLSSSPSNWHSPQDGPRFPRVTLFDNVACQNWLLTEAPRRPAHRPNRWLVDGGHAGLSMGRLSIPRWWRRSFLIARPRAALPSIMPSSTAQRPRCRPMQTWCEGEYGMPPERGLRAFGRVYVAWAYSAKFFKDGLYRQAGVRQRWKDWPEIGRQITCDGTPTICSRRFGPGRTQTLATIGSIAGDFDGALRAIRARAIVMPSSSDMYFVPEENEAEVERMPHAELRAFDTAWGHCVGSPGRVA